MRLYAEVAKHAEERTIAPILNALSCMTQLPVCGS